MTSLPVVKSVKLQKRFLLKDMHKLVMHHIQRKDTEKMCLKNNYEIDKIKGENDNNDKPSISSNGNTNLSTTTSMPKNEKKGNLETNMLMFLILTFVAKFIVMNN